MTDMRPRRSVLYMPGSNARALEKAKTLRADGFIFDLEDAVAPDAKDDARTLVSQAVKAGGYGRRETVIRVNGADTPWAEADLAAAAQAGPDAVLLPKIESAEQVRAAAAVLERQGARPDTALWCMMETPRGILQAQAIADAHPRLACLVMGTSDLVKDLNAAHTPLRLPVLTSLSLCLLAARAAGLSILDGVHLDLQDEAGFEASCEQGDDLGFDGKTLIHPGQIATANRVFAPSTAALQQAQRIIAAYRAARDAGQGIAVLDGKLVENLHVAQAERLVALGDAIKALEAGT